jgi:protein SCO1
MTTKLPCLLILASTLAFADDPARGPSPRAKAQPAAGPKECACCREIPAAAFTRESVYQLDARFVDDSGKPFSLGSLRGRPVVVDMFYTQCGNACPMTVTDMLAIQGRLPGAGRAGTAFVLVSFDEARDTPASLARYRAQRRLDGQWVLLHGSGESVRELAALLGVKYQRGADGSYAHSNLLTVLNAEGEIIHQRVGLRGGLDETLASLSGAAK